MKTTFSLCLLFVCVPALAQDVITVPFTSSRWQVEGENSEIVLYKGFESLRMQGGAAWLEDVNFQTGTIDFDMAFPSERGFQGVRWHIQDRTNFEEFYLRSHLSGMPDANQYNPVLAGVAAWQLYHGVQYSAPTHYSSDWTHVRIVIGQAYGDVYIDSDEPVLTFQMKGELGSGGLGVYASPLIPAYFANFKYSMSLETIRGSFQEFRPPDPGTVLRWEASDTFDESSLDRPDGVSSDFIAGRTWRTIEADENGITNLARVAGENEGRTILARITFQSAKIGIVPVAFGYSDRARVYLNGEHLYTGDNTYRTRDYRYLGTIGYFDTLPLHVAKGENELVFAVSEAFGGWGIAAKILSLKSLTIQDGTVQE